jgi:hypothetical protein
VDAHARPAGAQLTTWDVCHEVVKPETKSRRVAYLKTLREADLGEADVYVSHSWSFVFNDVVAALDEAVWPGEHV